MDDHSLIFGKLQCPKCKQRLNKPFELQCKHAICRDCLETILRNHRTDACCPSCNQVLGNYQIENYNYLSSNHVISRLLSSFTDVNQCGTCQRFTTVKECLQCSKDQCDSCSTKHEETHRQIEKQSSLDSNEFSEEEMQILQSIKHLLSPTEFDHFLRTAKTYLNSAVSRQTRSIPSNDEEPVPSDPTKTFTWTESQISDWSKHQRFTADDICNSTPQRVKELLRLDFTPRPYQVRMARTGFRKDNSLVCMQTGAGKTFVAGMVAKFLYIQSRQSVGGSSGRFKAVFLVPIKALVDQQCTAFRKVFPDDPDSILIQVDNQLGERFQNLYRQFDIFFFTVQKFVNFVDGKHTDLSKFDLIIIDECHHCYDNHPINSMMRQYHRLKASNCQVPQIIALTASVGTNKKQAFNHLIHLCANLDCIDIRAIQPGVEEEELRSSTNTPLADTIVTIAKEENDSIVLLLKDNVMKAISQRLGMDISTMEIQNLENYLVLAHQNACKTNDRDAIIGCDYLRNFHRFLLYYNDLPLLQCSEWLNDRFQGSTPDKPIPFDDFCRKKLEEFRQCIAAQTSFATPVQAKLEKLVEMIVNLHKPNARGLILVRTKFHTVALKEFLNKRPEMKENQIVAGHLTGQGSTEDLGLPGTQQATVLNEFRKGTKNLLVATDVAQEGLDVAECSYVIRYEFVSNEIGTVQSRGRARAVQSKCFLITEALSINYLRELENREKEKEMKEAIEEWRARGIEEFQSLVLLEQDNLIKQLCLEDSQLTIPTSPPSTRVVARTIHCRYCDAYLCQGSSLRSQGTTVVCTGSTLQQLVNPPKSAGAKFVCPNGTCHRELGVVILLSRNIPAYALQITALKFLMTEENEPRLFKKWSHYQGYIQPLY